MSLVHSAFARKPVLGFEGLYDAVSSGEIVSLRTGRALKTCSAGKGYRVVTLCAGREHKRYVHRLICEAFHGAANGLHVNHRDGDKTNNSPDNLEWVTVTQNNHHAILTGLRRVSRQCVQNVRASTAQIIPANGDSQ